MSRINALNQAVRYYYRNWHAISIADHLKNAQWVKKGKFLAELALPFLSLYQQRKNRVNARSDYRSPEKLRGDKKEFFWKRNSQWDSSKGGYSYRFQNFF